MFFQDRISISYCRINSIIFSCLATFKIEPPASAVTHFLSQNLHKAQMVQLEDLCPDCGFPDDDPVTGDHGYLGIPVERGHRFLNGIMSSSPISTVTASSPERMILRVFMVWGAMGVMIIILALGETTGPPADRLYPVEPVGVDTIMPSAVKEFKYSSLTYTS